MMMKRWWRSVRRVYEIENKQKEIVKHQSTKTKHNYGGNQNEI